jgi:anaerobic ribonucleoside-triphosphate reductase activating protein
VFLWQGKGFLWSHNYPIEQWKIDNFKNKRPGNRKKNSKKEQKSPMNYAEIKLHDTTNGPSIRVSLFVSGCSLDCKGCFNKDMQDFNYGKPFTEVEEDLIIEQLKKPYISGLSLLGGDPMHPANSPSLVQLVERARKEVPDIDVWCWTGYDIDYLALRPKSRKLLDLCDIVIDGPFKLNQRNLRLKYRGSNNQRVIKVNYSKGFSSSFEDITKKIDPLNE